MPLQKDSPSREYSRSCSPSNPTLHLPLNTDLSVSEFSVSHRFQQLAITKQFHSHSPQPPRTPHEQTLEMVHERFQGMEAAGDIAQNGLPFPSPLLERPVLTHRTTSFTKRHASFDSPREVPLPFMPSRTHHLPYTSQSPSHVFSQTSNIHQDSDSCSAVVQASDSSASDLHSDFERAEGSFSSDSLPSVPSSSSSLSLSPHTVDTKMGNSSSPYYMDDVQSTSSSSQFATVPQSGYNSRMGSTSTPVPLFSRPSSSPNSSRYDSGEVYSPTPVRVGQPPDRSSTASLPLPANVPYHTLPWLSGAAAIQEDQEIGESNLPSRTETAHNSSGPHRASSPPLLPQFVSSSSRPEWMSGRTFAADAPFMPRSYSSASNSAVSDPDRPFPPPAPPTILTPPPPPLTEDVPMRAPHEPFLSHAPAPQDSYIAVETSPREYRLIVRLPGFSRDAITLSTRRRRILHVVADSWEPNGGGHFERRISFGYDADLGQVRAEFDGELLRVIVPRRIPPMAYWGRH